MRRSLLIAAVGAALVVAATKASAEIEEYSSHVRKGFEDPEPVVSRDGYHFGSIHREKGRERLYKDAAMIAEGDAESFSVTEKGAFLDIPSFPAALSGDGGVLIHTIKSRDASGVVGWRLGVNGAAKGAVHAKVLSMAVSDHGSNLALSTMESGSRFSVFSLAGEGPSFGTPSDLIGVSDDSVLFRAAWNGRYWLYRDNAALPNRSYDAVAASPDLRSIAGVYSDGFGGQAVELNGHSLGSWPEVSKPNFDGDGHDLIFLARTSRTAASGTYDAAVVNGSSRAIPPQEPANGFSPAARPGDGAPFLAVSQGGKAKLYAAGRMLPEIGDLHRMAHWIAFTRSGSHWAVFVQDAKGKTDLIVDGQAQEGRFLGPLASTRLVFDTENEYHYLGDSIDGITLICGALKGAPSPDGPCVRYGKRLDTAPRFRARDLPDALPAARAQ